MNKTFGVIGGDRRQAELARLLAEEGRTVWTSGVAGCPDLPAQAAAADVVILPLPLCREDGILNSETEDLPTSALFRRFSPGQLLLAGQVRPAQQIDRRVAIRPIQPCVRGKGDSLAASVLQELCAAVAHAPKQIKRTQIREDAGNTRTDRKSVV